MGTKTIALGATAVGCFFCLLLCTVAVITPPQAVTAQCGINEPAQVIVSGDGSTVNVAHANLFVGMSARAFATDLAQVVAHRPDFVTLNETYHRSDSELTPPGYAAWRAGRPEDARETPVLWRTDAWELVDRGTRLMHSRPVKWGIRYVNWATLRSRTSDAAVSVISGHASPGGPGRQGLLQAFVRSLDALVSELATNGPVFVGADLNTHYPNSEFLRTWMRGSGTTSTFDTLGEPVGGWVTGKYKGTIDYVLVAGGQPVMHATHRLPNSDHRLVTAGIRLPSVDGTITESAVATIDSEHPDHLPAVDSWSEEQVGNAAAIIAAGVEIGTTARAQRIALMTAIGESSLRVLNYGDSAGPDSRGLFQQRANGAWGSLEERMDPRRSSLNFYEALMAVDGWSLLPPTIAAHRAQNNADLYHYEHYWEPAGTLMAALTGLPAASTELCVTQTLSTGEITWPVPEQIAASSNLDNYGASGPNWTSTHTGTDFAVPCGTPVLASHSGMVEIDTSAAWSGRWLVKVTTGPRQLSTWYAHMKAVTVSSGQNVRAGEQIGLVGSEGNSTDCHLHFEVHPAGGSMYEDDTDPTDWLTERLADQGQPN